MILYIGEGEGNVINVINKNSRQIYKVIRNKKLRGLIGKESLKRMLNAVIMHVKLYIYRQQLFHANKLDSLEWFYEFKMYLLREKQICSAELKQKKFEMWEATLQNMYA